jgi:hypothetical protein
VPEEDHLPSSFVLREDPAIYRIKHEGLSDEAMQIRAIIQLPLSQRIPVHYQGAFLGAYQPNKTFYLPVIYEKSSRK